MANIINQTALENCIRTCAMEILGLPDNDEKTVRFMSWGSDEAGSAPAGNRMQNIVYIDLHSEENEYQTIHELKTQDRGNEKLDFIDRHTFTWRLKFILYGAKSFAYAQKLKTGFYLPDIQYQLREFSFFIAPASPSIIHVPELIANQWWKRHDLQLFAYQGVEDTMENAINPVESITFHAVSEKTEVEKIISTPMPKKKKGAKQ